MHGRIWTGLLGVVGVLSLALTAGVSTAVAASAQGGTVFVADNEEPDSLNPYISTMAVTFDVLAPVEDSVLSYRPTNFPGNNQHWNFVPTIVTKIPTPVVVGQPGPNAQVTITYNIKPGLKWSDGQPVTSKDFWFTWKAVENKNTGSPEANLGFNQITAIDTPNALTAVVHMKGTFGPWEADLFGNGLLPYHVLKNDVNNLPHDTAFNRAPVTIGPFKVLKWVAGQYIELVPNPYYGGEDGVQPHVSKLIFNIVKDYTTAADQMKTGQITMADQIQPDQQLLAQFASTPGVKTTNVPGLEYQQWTFNLKDPVAGDLAVRQAFYYAMNRQQMDQVVANNKWQIATTDQAPLSWAYDPHLKVVTQNVAKAQALLKADGYKMGADGFFQKNGQDLTLTVDTTSGNTLRTYIMEMLIQQEAQAGIKIESDYMAASQLFGQAGPLYTGTFQVAQFAWISGTDPDDSSIWNSTIGNVKTGGEDFGFYKNAVVDSATYQALYAMDQKAREAAYWKVQEQLAKDLPMVPLFYMPEYSAYTSNLHGVVGNNFGYGLFNANYWTLSKAQ